MAGPRDSSNVDRTSFSPVTSFFSLSAGYILRLERVGGDRVDFNSKYIFSWFIF